MEAWWLSLDTSLQVFYAIAISTSLLLVLQLLLMVFGLDFDSEVDLDTDVEHAGGTSVLSVRSITAFFTGFGWAGVSALKAGLGLPAAIAVATATGGAMMAVVFLLMRGLYGLRHSGTLDYKNAIGVVGSVYLPVPGAMRAAGQVEVMVQSRLRVVQAFTRAPETLPNRARVRVVDVLDQQTLLVEPLDSSAASQSDSKES